MAEVMMNLTTEQIQLASLIDAHVSRYPDTGRGDEQLLVTLTDYLVAFKRILDSATPVQMDTLCQQYPGFYRLAMLLESLAQGIAEGEIEGPKVIDRGAAARTGYAVVVPLCPIMAESSC